MCRLRLFVKCISEPLVAFVAFATLIYVPAIVATAVYMLLTGEFNAAELVDCAKQAGALVYGLFILGAVVDGIIDYRAYLRIRWCELYEDP